jgi:hypothetical protein
LVICRSAIANLAAAEAGEVYRRRYEIKPQAKTKSAALHDPAPSSYCCLGLLTRRISPLVPPVAVVHFAPRHFRRQRAPKSPDLDLSAAKHPTLHGVCFLKKV